MILDLTRLSILIILTEHCPFEIKFIIMLMQVI